MNRVNITKPFKKLKKQQNYRKDKQLIEEVFHAFEYESEDGLDMNDLTRRSGIPRGRLYDWHKKWEKDNKYRPGKYYGKHKRLFTQEQEKAVADFLRIQYILPGVLARRKHVRRIIMDLWKSFNPDKAPRAKNVVSYHFLRDFCKRQKLSFRNIRKKKRSIIDPNEVKIYAEEYAEVFGTIPWNRILNVDETPLNYVTATHEILSECGTEEVNGQLPIEAKLNFTVIATIAANGDKMPPVFLAQGKTPQCLQQFADMETSEPYELLYSPGGFTNEAVMIQYLRLVKNWMHNENTILILDRYAAHKTDNVYTEAQNNNIRLVFIPTSATDIYQPLDRRIFGAIKSKYASKCDDFLFEHDTGLTKSQAADMFLTCWRELSRATVISAWELNEESDTDDSDYSFEDQSEFDDDEEEEEEEMESSSYDNLTPPRKIPKRTIITPPRSWLK